MKKRKPCKRVNPHMKIKENFVGLFDFTYNDIKNSKKISLEDIGVLAYGCFIHYEPETMKWFKQLKERAIANPDKKFWEILNIRRRLIRHKDTYKDRVAERIKNNILPKKNIRSDLFVLRTSVKCSFNRSSKLKIEQN